jgi:hypothetical protein
MAQRTKETAMNFTRVISGLLLTGCMIAVLRCTGPITMAGNSSQTPNATVAGIIYEPDGKTPADNAIVQFIPSKNIPSPHLNKSQATTYSTTTNNAGQYFADSVPAGYYNVFGSKGEDLCYAESVIVNDTTPLRNDTLKAPGSLKGVIRLAPGHDSRHVLILIFGSNSFASPSDSIGNFLLTDMAEGNYHVRLLATGGGYNYLPLDTVFSIVSGENKTLSDTIFMRLDSLDAPVGVTAKAMEYGSVLVSWHKITAAIVYSIYRNVTDTGTYSYIGHTIDTFYNDGINLDYGRVYYYKMQAANSMAASPYSSPCSVLTTPAPPESVTVVALADSQIRVSWHSVRSATGYRVYIQKEDGSYDSTNIVVDTVDTLHGIYYRNWLIYQVKSYNPSGKSQMPIFATNPFGAILCSPPFFADSGIVFKEQLKCLYDSTNFYVGVDTGGIIRIFANNKYAHLLVVGDSSEYVAGSKIYNYSQLITEIRRFLQDSIDSHIIVTRNPDNSIQITNPSSSNFPIDFQLLDILSNSLMGSMRIGDSIRSEKVIIRNFRPARGMDLINNLFDVYGNAIGSPRGLENGATISISGQVGGITIQTGIFTYSQTTSTMNDLFGAIRAAFNLPANDGTPDNNYSVSMANKDLIIENQYYARPATIRAGSIVIRCKPGSAYIINNPSIQANDLNPFDNIGPGRFNYSMGFDRVGDARD